MQKIWNVYGKIVGLEQMVKKIIIGNCCDLWLFGVVDLYIGMVIMVELVCVFGDFVVCGW